jgi:DNA-binding XRE family transcriptional regulator
MGKDHKDLVVLLTHKRKEAGITQASLAEAVQVSR